MNESTSHHDNLRDQIGQALNDAIASGGEADYCDSREIDRLADAVLAVLPPSRDADQPGPQACADSNSREIDGIKTQQAGALTDERAHEILVAMSLHVYDWAERAPSEPSPAALSKESIRFILAELERAQ